MLVDSTHQSLVSIGALTTLLAACYTVYCLSTRTGLNCVNVAPCCLYALHASGEYIDDTEDLINIQLDYSRNKLIRFEIILTTGTFAIAIFSAVAGMLGENLALPEIITEVRLWDSVGG